MIGVVVRQTVNGVKQQHIFFLKSGSESGCRSLTQNYMHDEVEKEFVSSLTEVYIL